MRKSETLREMLRRSASKETTTLKGKQVEAVADTRSLTTTSVITGGKNDTIGYDLTTGYHDIEAIMDLAEGSISDRVKKEQAELNADFNSDIKKSNTNVEVYLMIPDVHSYARDHKAYELAMQSAPILADNYNITKVVQMGDLIENGEYSSHGASGVGDYVKMSYKDECKWATDEFWTRLQRDVPGAEYHQLMGNHEDRISKYYANRIGASEMHELMVYGIMPDGAFEDRGIHVTPYGEADTRDSILILDNDLVCVHGWSHSTHAAKTHLAKIQGRSVLFGHTHRIQSYVERDAITNKMRGAWSFGSLAKNNMTYQKGQPNDHLNGFGLVLRVGDHFRVDTIPVTEEYNGQRMVILPVAGGHALTL